MKGASGGHVYKEQFARRISQIQLQIYNSKELFAQNAPIADFLYIEV